MLRISRTDRFGGTRARRLACLASLAAVVALAASAQSAAAATSWHFGPLVKTWINDCYTFDVVNGVGEYAGAHYDSATPPKTGDVFYVNVVVNGIDASCAEITFPEIKLPAGVSAAISTTNPIACFKVDNAAVTETPDTADCPHALGAPLYGGTGSIRNVNGPSPGTWDTRAPNAWEFRIPLVASTAGLKAISFPTQVISGSITQKLEPSISLPIGQGPVSPPPGPPETPHHKLALSPSAKRAKLSRRGALSFTVTPDGNGSAIATGTIRMPKGAKAVRFGKRKVKLTAGKRTRVTLTLSKKNATAVRKALRRRKKLSAKITLAAVSASGDTSTKRLTLKLKR
jgi:hypothetical protein